MFKKFTFITVSLFVIIGLAVVGCTVSVRGSGNVVEEGREVAQFDRVALDGMGEIILTQGDETSVVIEAEDNLMEYIKTSVRGDELIINIQSRRPLLPTEPLKFYVTTPNIEGVSIDGLGALTAEEIDTDSIEIEINGSGSAMIDDLDADSLAIDIDGLGSVELAGEVENQDVDINGSGSYNGRQLESESADIDIDGLGSATITVEDNLEVNIDGSGQVTYYGNPEVDKNINGVGRVVNR
ncbi:MAG: head GIN domain-containing protein [Chloroflexota bacterium]